MTNDLMKRPTAPSGMVSIEQERAVMEVQAAVMVAKRFPRFLPEVKERVVAEFGNKDLAEKALYTYPRGDTTVEGISIRGAEVLARNFQNMQFGVREISQRSGESDAEAFAWDIENNVKESRQFIVKHERHYKNGSVKILTDPRDIYEMVANQGARRMRACILAVIPKDIQDAAVENSRKTLLADEDPIEVKIRKMVAAFKEIGVTTEMLKKRLGHVMKTTTVHEVLKLKTIYRSIRDNMGSIDDYFGEDPGGASGPSTTDKLKGAGGDPELPVECTICGYKCKSARGLSAHMTRSHNDVVDRVGIRKPDDSGTGENDVDLSGDESGPDEIDTSGEAGNHTGENIQKVESDPEDLNEKRQLIMSWDRGRKESPAAKKPYISIARNSVGVNKQALILDDGECDLIINEYKSLIELEKQL